MLVAFDIGNTNIVIGCFDGKEIRSEFRLKTDPGRTLDEYAALLIPLFERSLGRDRKFSKAIVSSVVPPITPHIVSYLEDHFSLKPIIIGPGVKTGLPINMADPSSVGSDRIVNAVAAKALFGTPALVIDFGTATSFDIVSAQGSYEGGIIAPGVAVALDSLVRNTAKLPRIELAWPQSAIGKSTVSAMQIGSVMGYVCMVDGLIDRLTAELGKIDHIIATGGLGDLMTQHSARIRHYDPHLTLKGMQIIAGLNG